MPVIDPSTPLGQVRLRVADYGDLPYLPDSVYLQALSDSSDNVPAAAKTCAVYILGQLAFKTHRKMGLQLEVWGAEAYKNYKDFLLLTIKDPTFSNVSPIAYSAGGNCPSELVQFMIDFNKNYYAGTQSQEMAAFADVSPNDGTRLGPYGSYPQGWIVE